MSTTLKEKEIELRKMSIAQNKRVQRMLEEEKAIQKEHSTFHNKHIKDEMEQYKRLVSTLKSITRGEDIQDIRQRFNMTPKAEKIVEELILGGHIVPIAFEEAKESSGGSLL